MIAVEKVILPNDSVTHTRPPKVLRRIFIAIVGLIGLIAVGGIGFFGYAASILNPVTNTPVTATPNSFDGRYLLAVSDADMVGSAYADGILKQVPGLRDTLTILSLPFDGNNPQMREVFVSNSVASWPQVIVASPDGERAYIVETVSEFADDIEQVELPFDRYGARSLTVVDLNSGDTQVYDVMDKPIHVAIHPDEQWVAIGAFDDEFQLGILPVATLDNPETYHFFPMTTSDGQSVREVTSVYWHPNGRYLAVGIDRRELVFYEVVQSGDDITLRQHGDYLILGNTISYGQFTQDGQYYLTTEINWNTLQGQLGYVQNPRGEMISVRFDESEEANHAVVSRVEVGQSPEGFAVSPDERLVVTVDMRRTYLPDNLQFIAGSDLNSLTLLTFDNQTGELAWVDDYGFEGVLPEHASFDADGDSLAVVIYNKREAPLENGYLEFWNVSWDGAVPSLQRTATRVEVVRGPHNLAFIP